MSRVDRNGRPILPGDVLKVVRPEKKPMFFWVYESLERTAGITGHRLRVNGGIDKRVPLYSTKCSHFSCWLFGQEYQESEIVLRGVSLDDILGLGDQIKVKQVIKSERRG